MMENKFTPGPWFVDPNDPTMVWAPDTDPDEDEEPWCVARAVESCGHPRDQVLENARLIAAAPDLLDVTIRAAIHFRELEKIFGHPHFTDRHNDEEVFRLAAEQCEVVISKATQEPTD